MMVQKQNAEKNQSTMEEATCPYVPADVDGEKSRPRGAFWHKSAPPHSHRESNARLVSQDKMQAGSRILNLLVGVFRVDSGSTQ